MRFLKMFLFALTIGSIVIFASIMGVFVLTDFMNGRILSGIGCAFLFMLCITLIMVIVDGYINRGWFDL